MIDVTCPDCGVIRHLWPYEIKKYKGSWCKHCGQSRRAKAQMTKHGARFHPLYNTWKNVRRRISDPRFKDYTNLDIDPAWQNDVWNFIRWAENAGWKPGLSIERRDNKRGYWPDNCCFIPLGDQARHTSRNTIDWDIAKEVHERVATGEIRNHVAKSVAQKYGISYWTVSAVAYGRAWV